jgi:hypothetical protein
LPRKQRRPTDIGFFVVLWLGIGLVVGWIAALSSTPQLGVSAPTAQDITTGILIAAVLALGAVAYTLTSGTRLVLAVAGAQPADPQRYAQLCNLVEALASAMEFRRRPSTLSRIVRRTLSPPESGPRRLQSR